ncbi:YibE/F family protein [Lactobacillus sp. LC28-10]|uniref:YibE/F family protein n=1 Tax=Secundilactobacillus angelensis TaxID=2722706 RepID=A0ABX1KW41_9LACO|nr:YibE/F family protein [Secundilactobacillus angelensis]MCH5462372.1 YibE/F family protein [Secundilactobacillus angelensis]NLR18146.1 YibE/F family protein [Secundilactobacillus angelensis]
MIDEADKQHSFWRRWWPYFVVILGGLLVLGVAHDDGLYQTPILSIQSVKKMSSQKQSDQFNNEDQQVEQQLRGVITNGQHKGRQLTIDNTYLKSQATTLGYHTGQKVFLTVHHNHGNLSATISNLKRDTALAFTAWLTVSLLLVLMRFSGLMALTSVIVNGVLFWLAVNWNTNTQGGIVLVIFGGLAIVFAALTLLIVIGFNRQMLMTLLATIGGTALSIIVALVVFALTHERGVYYESMQYVTQLPRPLFLAETILGSLGAVMDESTDIIASLMALKAEKPDISAKQIFKSGRQIGGEIMGPLVNVLFFIFVAETLPLALLFLKNANSWGYTFNMTMSLGVVQSLISGIGIVLTIPLACGITSLMIGGHQSWGRLRH